MTNKIKTHHICTYTLYSQFHKTLPKYSLQMHWISVTFSEMGDMLSTCGGIHEYDFKLVIIMQRNGGGGRGAVDTNNIDCLNVKCTVKLKFLALIPDGPFKEELS